MGEVIVTAIRKNLFFYDWPTDMTLDKTQKIMLLNIHRRP